MMLKIPAFFLIAATFLSAFAFVACAGKEDVPVIVGADAVTYFIDSENGNDNNIGTTEVLPWKSITKLEQTELLPGDIVRFKRGSSFTGPLTITNSGKNSKYIIQNNLYFAASGTLDMGKEGPGTAPVYGDPGFVNYPTGNQASDFAVKTGSPAINKGLGLSYDVDFAGTPIPQSSTPDIGAYEYKAQ